MVKSKKRMPVVFFKRQTCCFLQNFTPPITFFPLFSFNESWVQDQAVLFYFGWNFQKTHIFHETCKKKHHFFGSLILEKKKTTVRFMSKIFGSKEIRENKKTYQPERKNKSPNIFANCSRHRPPLDVMHSQINDLMAKSVKKFHL